MVKTGLVLGGGGTRGFAHIGVLKVLKDLDIKIDAVAGCSIGAFIGASFCAGNSPYDMERYVKKIGLLDMFDMNISMTGIRTTNKLHRIFNEFVGEDKFEDLDIPLYVNAVNLSKAREEVFCKGNLFEAIRASVTIPGLVSPYKISDNYYVDGGIMNIEPVSILPKNIKRYIIVDVSPLGKMDMKKANVLDIIDTSMKIMQKESGRLKNLKHMKNKFVLIKPKVAEHHMLESKNKYQEIIDKGEKAAKMKKQELLSLSKVWYKF
ncbi:patatin-like phospholipase family protein [Candidatus Woesearchaeota archaeon]|nr:patatin-like phospholipase family protein [Candidatus Woesearchaeota archaeon]